MQVNVHEAKTQLSKLLERVLAGDEVVIARRGVPIVRLVAFEERRRPVLGGSRGLVEIAPDFDAPLDMFSDYE